MSDIVFDPLLPVGLVGLLALLLGAATVYVYFTVSTQIGRAKNVLLTAFRLAGIVLVAILLLQPSRLETISPPEINKVTVLALDTSSSMNQVDSEKMSRMESAKNLLFESEILPRDTALNDPRLRLFEFNDDAIPVSKPLSEVTAEGQSTRFHHSLSTIVNSLSGAETARAIIFLTDGHDFELINPTKSGFLARGRQIPIYAVPFGKQGKVRDLSIRITNYQPYCYVKQKARITTMLRLLGAEFEELQVQLLRENQIVQTRRVNAEEHQTIPVYFEVVEPTIGQFEYEVRVVPLEGELDTVNNSAITYLNVIDQQIQVLVLEGSPYWDTTFLQRSLMRNDKMEVDSALQYAPRKARLIRKKESTEELKIPDTSEGFNHYDLVVLGKAVDQLLNAQQLAALQTYVKELGGAVVFSRGKAFGGELEKNDLEPVIWNEQTTEKPRFQVAREGQSLAPFRVLSEQNGGVENLPELLQGHYSSDKKTLAATLAFAQNPNDGVQVPAVIHRRFGQGQVLSIGVDGIWRWAFNAKVDGPNNSFDRFWDQLVLWLMAGRDFIPTKQFSFRTSSANILLGEKVHFRLVMKTPDANLKKVPLTISLDGKELSKTAFTPNGEDAFRLGAEFLPEKPGRYRAVANFPDGTQQESKFIVFHENLEETEVATDVTYLKRLCESSGGRLLDPNELAKFMKELRDEKSDSTPKTRLRSVWDQTWIFYSIGLLFGVDWYLRRRWGLC